MSSNAVFCRGTFYKILLIIAETHFVDDWSGHGPLEYHLKKLKKSDACMSCEKETLTSGPLLYHCGAISLRIYFCWSKNNIKPLSEQITKANIEPDL